MLCDQNSGAQLMLDGRRLELGPELLPDAALVPRHARLRLRDEGWELRPVRGEVVHNGRPISGGTTLRPGDRLGLGEIELRFEPTPDTPCFLRGGPAPWGPPGVAWWGTSFAGDSTVLMWAVAEPPALDPARCNFPLRATYEDAGQLYLITEAWELAELPHVGPVGAVRLMQRALRSLRGGGSRPLGCAPDRVFYDARKDLLRLLPAPTARFTDRDAFVHRRARRGPRDFRSDCVGWGHLLLRLCTGEWLEEAPEGLPEPLARLLEAWLGREDRTRPRTVKQALDVLGTVSLELGMLCGPSVEPGESRSESVAGKPVSRRPAPKKKPKPAKPEPVVPLQSELDDTPWTTAANAPAPEPARAEAREGPSTGAVDGLAELELERAQEQAYADEGEGWTEEEAGEALAGDEIDDLLDDDDELELYDREEPEPLIEPASDLIGAPPEITELPQTLVLGAPAPKTRVLDYAPPPPAQPAPIPAASFGGGGNVAAPGYGPPTGAPMAPPPLPERRGRARSERKRAKGNKSVAASASPTLAGGLREVEVYDELTRRTTVRYYRQMNPGQNFPLITLITKHKVRKLIQDKVAQVTSKKGFSVKKENPFVTVRPIFPGCLCVPSELTVDISPTLAEAKFWLTPTGEGQVWDARVEIWYEGKRLDSVPTPTRVARQTRAKLLAGFAFVAPAFKSVLGAYDIDLQERTGSLVRSLVDFAGGPESFGWVLGVLALVAAFVSYVKARPRRGPPVVQMFEYDVQHEDDAKAEVFAKTHKAFLLVLIAGEARVLPVKDAIAVIGNDPNVALPVVHPSISPEHASIEMREGRFSLLPRKGPVSLDGSRISGRTPLGNVSALKLGKLQALFSRHGQARLDAATRQQLVAYLVRSASRAERQIRAAFAGDAAIELAGQSLVASKAITASLWVRAYRKFAG